MDDLPALDAKLDARLAALLKLTEAEREAELAKLTELERRELRYHWHLWARSDQLPPPGAWSAWLICAGRGFGKTRAGAEWVRETAKRAPEARIALVGASLAEVRAVMVEGESGILACSPPHRCPVYEPSLRRIVWANGAQALARLDVMVQTTVLAERAEPPVDPQPGDAYLVASGAGGEWLGRDESIAAFQGAHWLFVPPVPGASLRRLDTGQIWIFVNGWSAAAEPAQPEGGTTIDTEARAAIAALVTALRQSGIFPAI